MHRTGSGTRSFRPPESWAPADLIDVAHIRMIPIEFPPGRSTRSLSRPTLTSDENDRISEPSTSVRQRGDLLRRTSARSPVRFWRNDTNRHSACQADGPSAASSGCIRSLVVPRRVRCEFVIPAKAGIQRARKRPRRLDPRLRGDDGKNRRPIGSTHHHRTDAPASSLDLPIGSACDAPTADHHACGGRNPANAAPDADREKLTSSRLSNVARPAFPPRGVAGAGYCTGLTATT